MKKIKLIPSLILLALCIAILGIGIYAAAPAGNTITGTVTITAASAEVEVSVYQDDYNPLSPATNRQSTAVTRAGSSDLSMGAIALDASSAESIYDVPLKEVIIVVKNHSFSSDGQGMFFWKSTTEGAANNTLDVDGNGSVLVGDILYGHHKYDENDDGNALTTEETDVIDVEYEFYKHLPAATDVNSNGVWDEGTDTAGVETIRFYIRLDKLVEDDVDIDLDVKLYIEKYIPNYSSSQTGFVKIGVGDLTEGDIPGDYDTGVTHLTLPYGITSISGRRRMGQSRNFLGMDETDGCALATVGLPGSITDMGDYTFYYCSMLTGVFIPNSVTEIGDYAFEDCIGLTSAKISSSITSIGSSIFRDCAGLESISIDSNNATYDSRNNCNAIITTSSNSLLSGCKNTIIPSGVTSIGGSAFDGCTGLISIDIPSGVTSIGESAFSGCTALISIDIPSGVTVIADYAFYGCSSLSSVTIPSSVTGGISNECDPFGVCSSLTTIIFNGTLSYAYTLPTKSGHHWEFNGSTVTTIATGAAAQGTYTRVANS